MEAVRLMKQLQLTQGEEEEVSEEEKARARFADAESRFMEENGIEQEDLKEEMAVDAWSPWRWGDQGGQ